ncbi:Aste57867_449 [Aphanomyces stellatus]|uniref:Aste57867_449 protein n=1 Tax=Aphanomyces stellatus TaxID=120398 RepID=A0A485K6S3_9STRA|nr:hypothetical protein As57867_000448 [Aphanomyces stellatus]VFT77674.1 Aste57867_449 [Aphanomyces stellatus]
MDMRLLKGGSSVQAFDYSNANNMGVRPYGVLITLAMILNTLIGTGCFGLPYAFASAGIGLTSTLLLLGTLGSLVTVNYTLEAMARAEGILAAKSSSPTNSSQTTSIPTHCLTYRRINFSSIGKIFAGSVGYNVVQVSLLLYSFGSLWSYASIFASSTASMFFTYALHDSCDVYSTAASAACVHSYYVSMVLFSALVVAFVLMDMGEQASIQKFLTIYRILALFLMVLTMAIKLSSDGWNVVQARLETRGAWGFNAHHFALAFGATILALNCHHNMPDLMQPLSSKGLAREVAFAGMAISCVFYFLVGVLGALAFDTVNPLASLMWSDFSGCGNGWTACPTGAPTWLGSLVHIVVIMFPVVNVVSTYPIAGVTVGANILTSLPKSITAPLGPAASVRVARMLATIPPLVMAALFKKLDAIFTIAGLFGFAIGLVVPCWFQVIGIKYCRRHFGPTDDAAATPYSLPCLSSIETASVMLVLMLATTCVAVLSIIY